VASVTATCFVAIGNSDDKLTQAEWSDFWCEVNNGLHGFASHMIGEWQTAAYAQRQSACWCVHVPEERLADLRDYLSKVAGRFRQDSIALSIADTELITPPQPGERGTCALCGQEMIRTEDDCWHPHAVAKVCPPEPSSEPYDLTGWVAFHDSGLRPGRPGREHFIPAGDSPS
jgi:hypothetical protein